jgi:hypothetical protein
VDSDYLFGNFLQFPAVTLGIILRHFLVDNLRFGLSIPGFCTRSYGIEMKEAPAITLRPFERSDFKRLISWLPTPDAHEQWCGSFFGYPLDESRLQRYLESAGQPNAIVIFTAVLFSGEQCCNFTGSP